MAKEKQKDPRAEARKAGWALVSAHPLFRPLAASLGYYAPLSDDLSSDGWAALTPQATISVSPTKTASPEEWAYVFAHLLLHLGFEHVKPESLSSPRLDLPHQAAACLAVDRFLEPLKLGRSPRPLPALPSGDESRLASRWRDAGIPPELASLSVAGKAPDICEVSLPRWRRTTPFSSSFARGLSDAVAAAVEVAGGARESLTSDRTRKTQWDLALSWFVSSYPLLGAVAAGLTVVDDPQIVERLGIEIAAVSTSRAEVYVNSRRSYSDAEWRFVLAHEMLHAALKHSERSLGRNPELWNISCFPAGTLLPGGRRIEDVAPLSREVDENLVVLRTQAGIVEATAEHPFRVRKRTNTRHPIRMAEASWVKAEDVSEKDYLLVPVLTDKRSDTEIDLRPYIQEGVDSLGRPFGNRAVKSIPLDEDVAWLIGLYTAEGSSTAHVRFSLGAHEVHYAERINSIVRRLGWNSSHRIKDNNLHVDLGTTVFGRWLKEHCGPRAQEKKIPDVILRHEDPAIRHAYLTGLVDGDGHRYYAKQTPGVQITMVGTSSRALMQDVVLLLAQDKIGCATQTVTQRPREINGHHLPQNLFYRVEWRESPTPPATRILNSKPIQSYSRRWKADEAGVWYPVTKVASRHYAGPVYNLSTPSHTYVAHSYLVHNCDFVINGWLVEMGVGSMPEGLLYDPSLAALSAEDVYERITTDERRFRKLAALAGQGRTEWVHDRFGAPGDAAHVDLDEFYRRALQQGLELHDPRRGSLPAGLEEEIRALDAPAPTWDVQLARWFEEYVPLVEIHRSYARPSRRQASTPSIPRPGFTTPRDLSRLPTFGVVLDTSGSMDAALLGRALGAITSFSLTRNVPAVRVVYCDAVAYDAGYIPVESISQGVKVRGRGGTLLQPGIDLLENSEDFPADGPILVITDGYCEPLTLHRPHAFLLPASSSLPFLPKGPVFRLT